VHFQSTPAVLYASTTKERPQEDCTHTAKTVKNRIDRNQNAIFSRPTERQPQPSAHNNIENVDLNCISGKVVSSTLHRSVLSMDVLSTTCSKLSRNCLSLCVDGLICRSFGSRERRLHVAGSLLHARVISCLVTLHGWRWPLRLPNCNC